MSEGGAILRLLKYHPLRARENLQADLDNLWNDFGSFPFMAESASMDHYEAEDDPVLNKLNLTTSQKEQITSTSGAKRLKGLGAKRRHFVR